MTRSGKYCLRAWQSTVVFTEDLIRTVAPTQDQTQLSAIEEAQGFLKKAKDSAKS